MARHPDHAHVVAEIFAAELRADAERLRHLVDFLFHLDVAEGVAVGRAMGRQRVEIARGGKLHRLHAELGGGAADHDRQMIGRARRGAEREHLLLQEREQAIFRQHRGRSLEQEALVGGAAALGHEHELVGVITFGVDLALRRHVVGGVLLLIHRQRRHLRVAQIAAQIGVARAFGQRGLVLAVGDDVAALLAHDDAVPVSWHIGSTPPAAMLAFFRKSSATNLSFGLASLSSRMLRSCFRCPGRR